MTTSSHTLKKTLRSIRRAVDGYLEETPFERTTRSQRKTSSDVKAKSEGSGADLTTTTNEIMYQVFTALVQGRSWTPITNEEAPVAIELVRAKFERSLVLRCDGESIIVFTPHSALLQARRATTLQRIVLQHFVDMCGWNWARVAFDASPSGHVSLVLRNVHNTSVVYPLSEALRIEVPMALQHLCERAVKMDTAARQAIHLARMQHRREQEELDANSDVEDTLPEDVMPPRQSSSRRARKSRKSVSNRRRPRRGFRRDQLPKVLLSTIHRNSLFPMDV